MDYQTLPNKPQEIIWDLETNTLQKTPGACAIKSINSTFLDMSDATALLLGWKKASLGIGKTEYDIPCAIVKFVETHIKTDQNVIKQNKNLVGLCVGNYATGWSTLLFEKTPIKLNGFEEPGVFIKTIDMTIIVPETLKLYMLDSKFSTSPNLPCYYILSENQLSLLLTERQQECLSLLIRGKTAKQIANILDISLRTVEEHIIKIKQKLNCYNKSQLVEKAIDSGFLYYIPSRFFSVNLKAFF